MPAHWSVRELRNRREWQRDCERTRQPYRDRGSRQKKEKRKRKRRRLTGGRDRWETRAAATMIETRCRPLQYAKDWERGGRELKGAGRRWGWWRMTRSGGRNEKRCQQGKGEQKRREADRRRERKGGWRERARRRPETDFLYLIFLYNLTWPSEGQTACRDCFFMNCLGLLKCYSLSLDRAKPTFHSRWGFMLHLAYIHCLFI